MNDGYQVTYGDYRPFSQPTYDKADSPGKLTAIVLLVQRGWKPKDDSERYKLGDLIMEKNGLFASFEVEVRQGSWKTGAWPKHYKTIHFPPRKQDSPVDFFITFNESLDHALIASGSTVRNEKRRDVRDAIDHVAKQVNKNHSFVDVPLDQSWELSLVNGVWETIRKPKLG